MKQGLFKIKSNRPIGPGVHHMVLLGDCSAVSAPGQFINIKLEGFFLRRPISVCDVNRRSGELSIIYKVLGRGSAVMAELKEGEILDVLTGLGNGFSLEPAGDSPLLIGGGVGTPPMYMLAKELAALGKRPWAVLGFSCAEEAFFVEEFKALGCEVRVSTLDGSLGVKGFVTDAFPPEYSYYYACGPEAMLKAVWKKAKGGGQLSFEDRMGCGFGACMGCSCKTLTGYKRICKDGPVMLKEEILWED